MFEKQVLDFLDRIESNHDLSIRGLSKTGGANSNWTYHGPIRRYTFEEPIKELTNVVVKGERVHLVPPAPNFAAVDSIFKQRSVATTRLKSQVSGKYKSGSKKAHRLRSCALRLMGMVGGVLFLSCRKKWSLHSQSTRASGRKGWINMYWGWMRKPYSSRAQLPAVPQQSEVWR